MQCTVEWLPLSSWEGRKPEGCQEADANTEFLDVDSYWSFSKEDFIGHVKTIFIFSYLQNNTILRSQFLLIVMLLRKFRRFYPIVNEKPTGTYSMHHYNSPSTLHITVHAIR